MGEAKNQSGVLSAYGELLATTDLKPDEAQREIVNELQALSAILEGSAGSKRGFGRFFSRNRDVIEGLYIWGDVGRGKTFLMDLFFENVAIANKRRVHFHEFMDEVHQAIGEFRKKSRNGDKGFDPIALVVGDIVKTTRLLCFDEFHVSDITNAMLLGRLFEKMFEGGVVVVATSNSAPDRLYHNGLNRQLFLPFIELLQSNCKVLNLAADTDYRLEKLSRQPVFHFGSAADCKGKMDDIWRVLVGGQGGRQGTVFVLGRKIKVPFEAMGCARFEFSDLCDVALGSRDYLAISHAYHTLMIEGVPQFTQYNSNAAKRFIQLVDTLYDRGIKLVASFEFGFDALVKNKNMTFEFKRTLSRLNEMASNEYLARAVFDKNDA